MKANNLAMNGWLNIFKEKGYISSHVVREIKKKFNIKKIGHYGTLDPLASGVLPLALGEATKTIKFITYDRKEYSFFINWGKETDTCDDEGKVIYETDKRPKIDEIVSIIKNYFTGNITQIPPAFSALKINGKRAYELARKNIKFEIGKKNIEIYKFILIKTYSDHKAQFFVSCGPGTYVRALARDLAKKLNTLGHASDIVRLKNSYFNISDSINYERLIDISIVDLQNKLLPIDYVLKNIEEIKLEKKYSDMLKDGKVVFMNKHYNNIEKDSLFLIKNNSELVSIANLKKGYIIPRRNFNN